MYLCRVVAVGGWADNKVINIKNSVETRAARSRGFRVECLNKAGVLKL